MPFGEGVAGPDFEIFFEGASFVIVVEAEGDNDFPGTETGGMRRLSCVVFLEAAVTDEVVDKIRNWLPKGLRKKVLRDTKTVRAWVFAGVKRICREAEETE